MKTGKNKIGLISAFHIQTDKPDVGLRFNQQKHFILPEMATFPLQGSRSSMDPASDDLRVTFCMTWASFILCSSDM